MKVRYRIAIAILAALGTVILFKMLIGDSVVSLMAPRGTIAAQERGVIVKSVLIMLVVAVPMLVTLYTVAWKYRADNPKADRRPEKPHGAWGEIVLWAFPAVFVAMLGTVAWTSTHQLDPFSPIASEKRPITIQVIALEWKWLFIYPEQHVATVNFVEFPEGTPVHFELTADGPMSSFWIPQLGSQIYAMSAMQTQLNLMATSTGEFLGRENEINGVGYSGMTFTAKSVTRQEFDDWVKKTQGSLSRLDRPTYEALAKPSENEPPASFSWADPGIYDWVLTRDMTPPPSDDSKTMPETRGADDAPAPDNTMPDAQGAGMHM